MDGWVLRVRIFSIVGCQTESRDIWDGKNGSLNLVVVGHREDSFLWNKGVLISIPSHTRSLAFAKELSKRTALLGSRNVRCKRHGASAWGARREIADWWGVGYQDRGLGTCSSQTSATTPTSLTHPSTWVAILGQPDWSQRYSMSASSRPSGVVRPVLIVT